MPELYNPMLSDHIARKNKRKKRLSVKKKEKKRRSILQEYDKFDTNMSNIWDRYKDIKEYHE